MGDDVGNTCPLSDDAAGLIHSGNDAVNGRWERNGIDDSIHLPVTRCVTCRVREDAGDDE